MRKQRQKAGQKSLLQSLLGNRAKCVLCHIKAAIGALPQVRPSSQFEGATRQKTHSLRCLCFLSWLQTGNLSIQTYTIHIHADVAVLIAIAPLTPVFQCCVFPWQHVLLSACDVFVSHASYICLGHIYNPDGPAFVEMLEG